MSSYYLMARTASSSQTIRFKKRKKGKEWGGKEKKKGRKNTQIRKK